MDNLYDIFDGQQEANEQWREQRQAEREAVFDLADQTAASLADPARFQQYLDIQGRFPMYSVNNALLVQAQMPGATRLRDFDAWKGQGAFVQKGQKGVTILEPGTPFKGDDGQMHTPYNVKRVFDITQTDAKPAPEPPRDERQLLRALVDRSPRPCVASDQVPEGKAAHFDGKQIFVRRGAGAPELFRDIAIEMATARGLNPFQAKCAAHLLCRQHGFEPPIQVFQSFSMPGILLSGDPQAIRGELNTIRGAADEIGKRMHRNLNPPAKTDKPVVPE